MTADKETFIGLDFATQPVKTILHIDVSGFTEAEILDIQAHIAGRMDNKETYEMPKHGWTCFHCGETFLTPAGAELHFGKTPTKKPECIK